MTWKDCIQESPVRSEIFGKIPGVYPYWNFGVFGVTNESGKIMETIRKHFTNYCFDGWSKFGSCPHAG